MHNADLFAYFCQAEHGLGEILAESAAHSGRAQNDMPGISTGYLLLTREFRAAKGAERGDRIVFAIGRAFRAIEDIICGQMNQWQGEARCLGCKHARCN